MVSSLARRSPASLFARTGPRSFLGSVASSRPRFGLINASSTDKFYTEELQLALEPDLLSRAVFAEAVRADAGGRDPKK
jgi:hypothetical protein